MAAQQNSYVSAKKYIIVSKSATQKLGIVSENSILETSVTNVCVISEFINGGEHEWVPCNSRSVPFVLFKLLRYVSDFMMLPPVGKLLATL